MAFVYLDQGRFAYSQEVRLPGQPGTGVADAMGGRPDTDSADPRRLPCLHQRSWWGWGGPSVFTRGLGRAWGRPGTGQRRNGEGFYSLEQGLHGGSVGRTWQGREAGSGLAGMMIPVGSGSRAWPGGKGQWSDPEYQSPLEEGLGADITRGRLTSELGADSV